MSSVQHSNEYTTRKTLRQAGFENGTKEKTVECWNVRMPCFSRPQPEAKSRRAASSPLDFSAYVTGHGPVVMSNVVAAGAESVTVVGIPATATVTATVVPESEAVTEGTPRSVSNPASVVQAATGRVDVKELVPTSEAPEVVTVSGTVIGPTSPATVTMVDMVTGPALTKAAAQAAELNVTVNVHGVVAVLTHRPVILPRQEVRALVVAAATAAEV